MTETRTPTLRATGLRAVRAQQLDALGDELARRWEGRLSDPFTFDLAVVPGPGMQRWLSQRLALARDEGICAGIEFVTFDRLEHRIGGSATDPWRPSRATWTLHRLVTSEAASDVRLSRLSRHLRSSREPFSALSRIARRFADYAEWRPAMLERWRGGEDVDAEGHPLGSDSWQAHLWRLLRERSGGVDPLELHAQACAEVSRGGCDVVPPRVAVFAPTRLSPRRLELLAALGIHHTVDLLLLSSTRSWPGEAVPRGPRRDAASEHTGGHPLNGQLGREDRETIQLVRHIAPTAPQVDTPDYPDTLLGWLQSDLAADAAPVPRELRPHDESVRIHRSHGLDRQVEVLRDVLAGLMSADPTLQPKDIVVISPDVDAVAPLISAAFSVPPGNARAHPGHQFRVQIADRSAAQTNPLVPLLQQVLRLGHSRLEASVLLDFCAEPAVARRFGFGPDAHERLSELVTRANIRWGLNASHRSRFGLPSVRQNTWTAGVQRLLLGVALSEQGLPTAKTTLPVDDVESSDVELLGGIAELLGRLSRLVNDFEVSATLPVWLERCRRALGLLVSVPSHDEWQLSDVWAGLARIEERGPSGEGVELPLAAIQRVIDEEFATHPARASFGNGSLVVCGMSSLRRVPHRVVCLLGWDAGRYPGPTPRHGDDLMAANPWVGDPHRAMSERQALLDAVHAAREHLVIVYRGRSEATNEEVPAPSPLAELFRALDRTCIAPDGGSGTTAVTVNHRLQPFDPKYFDGTLPRSFDPVGLAGARAKLGPRDPMPPRFSLPELPELDLTEVSLDDLVSFFAHPVRHLLRVRAGLRWGEAEEIADYIPIELDGLARWTIGSRTLQLAQSGLDAARVTRAERLRGGVPPGELGRRAMDQILLDVDRVMKHLPPESAVAPVVRDVSVDLPTLVRGRVVVHERSIVTTEFSRLQPKHRLAAWVRLVVLAASEPGPWRAATVTPSRIGSWRSPDQPIARAILEDLVSVYRLGLRRPLPLAPRLCEEYAATRASGRDPADPKVEALLAKAWRKEVAFDDYWSVFFSFPEVLKIPREVGDHVGYAEERSLLGVLTRRIWDPLRSHEGFR